MAGDSSISIELRITIPDRQGNILTAAESQPVSVHIGAVNAMRNEGKADQVEKFSNEVKAIVALTCSDGTAAKQTTTERETLSVVEAW